MTEDFNLIETHFVIPKGTLQKFTDYENGSIILNILKKCFTNELNQETTKSQLESSLSQISTLKSTITFLENQIGELRSVESEKQKIQTEHSLTLSKLKEKDSKISLLEEFKVEALKKLEKQESSIHDMELKIEELYRNCDVKDSEINSLKDEYSETIKKWQKTNIEFKAVFCELEMLREREASSKKSKDRLSISGIDERIREMQNSLSTTISEYTQKLQSREDEITSLNLEIDSKNKRIQLLNSELIDLRCMRNSIWSRSEELFKRVHNVENDLKNELDCMCRRLETLEIYCTNQHKANLDVSNRLTDYLSFIDKLKSNLHASEQERISLTSELSSLKQELNSTISAADHRFQLAQKELSILRSQFDVSKSDRIPEDAMLDRELLESLSSTAVETSKLVRSGYTLTDIHAQYFRQHEECLRLKEENKIATAEYNKVLHEKAELKKSLIEVEQESESLINANSLLSKRLNESRTEILSLKSKLREMQTHCERLDLDLKKASELKLDLCGQITSLTTKIEKYRQNKSILSSLSDEELEMPLFNSVSQLQSVNCRLLETLHDLEAEIELLSQGKNFNEKIDESDLDGVKTNELTLLTKTLEITTYQRDVYKLLYNQKSGLSLLDEDLLAIRDHSTTNQSLLEGSIAKCLEQERTLEGVKSDYDLYKSKTSKEISELKEKKNLEELKVEKLQHRLALKKQKCKNRKLSLNAISEKSTNQDNFISTLERQLDEANLQRRSLENEYQALRTAHRMLTVEVENVRSIARNLETENKILIEEKARSHPVALQLQELSSQLSMLETIRHTGTSSSVSSIKQEISSLYFELSSLSSEFSAEKLLLNQKLDVLKKEFENEQKAHESTKNRLAELNSKLPQDFLSNQELEIPINNIELQTQLNHYKSIAQSAEIKLAEFKLQYQSLSDTLVIEREKLLSELEMSRQNLEKALACQHNPVDFTHDMSVNNDSLKDENKRLLEECAHLSSKLETAVLSHSDTIKRLNELSNKLQTNEAEMSELRNKLINTEELLKTEKERICSLNKQSEQMALQREEERVKHKQETDLLFDQIRDLRSNLQKINESLLGSSEVRTQTTEDEKISQSSCDLWRLLEFVRNEKALIQARLDNAAFENTRLNTKCAELRDTVNSLEKSLSAERELRFSQASIGHSNLSQSADIEARLTSENLELEQKLSKHAHTIESLEKRLNNTSSELESVKEQLSSCKNLYEDQFSRNDILKRQLDAANRNIALLKERLVSRKDNEMLKKQLIELTERLSQSERELNQYKLKDNSNKDSLSKLDEENKSLKNIIELQRKKYMESKKFPPPMVRPIPSPRPFDSRIVEYSSILEDEKFPNSEPSGTATQSSESKEQKNDGDQSTFHEIIQPIDPQGLVSATVSIVKPNTSFIAPDPSLQPKADSKPIFKGAPIISSGSTGSRFSLARNILKVNELLPSSQNSESQDVIEPKLSRKRPMQSSRSLSDTEEPGEIIENIPLKKVCETDQPTSSKIQPTDECSADLISSEKPDESSFAHIQSVAPIVTGTGQIETVECGLDYKSEVDPPPLECVENETVTEIQHIVSEQDPTHSENQSI